MIMKKLATESSPQAGATTPGGTPGATLPGPTPAGPKLPSAPGGGAGGASLGGKPAAGFRLGGFSVPGGSQFSLGGMASKDLGYGVTAGDVLSHGLPPQFGDAKKWGDTLGDKNLTWMSQDRWAAARNLDDWFKKNQSHPIVTKLMAHPGIKQQLDTYRSPIGQIGQTVAPMMGSFFSNPENLARIITMPGIKDVFQSTVGNLGIPGLAFANSFLSGNMRNWNTLMQGAKTASDNIDRHIARIRNKL